MLGFAGIPGVCMFVGFLFLPESPRWLVGKGYNKAARDVLIRIRGTTSITHELEDIIRACEDDRITRQSKGRQ